MRPEALFKSLCLALTIILAGNAARAEMLPWLADPFGAQKQLAPYGTRLRPEHCPALPELTRKLKLNEVVIAVLCHNPDTRAAYLSLLAQADTYATSYSSYFPTVTGSVDASRSTAFTDDSKSTSIGKSSGISAAMTLYDFGQREISIDIAELALTAAGYSYDSALQGMIATALQSYYRLLTSQNAVEVAKESERYALESFEAAQLRHELGLVPLADALQAKGSYSQAQLATQQSENQLSQNQAALAVLMGLPADTPMQVAELDDSNLMKEPFGGKVKEVMALARNKRVDLLASRTQLESSRASLKSLRRSQLATISAGVSGGINDTGYFSGNTSRSQSIGISVSVPIFNGFRDTYTMHAARKQLQAQEALLTRTELNVEQDVWSAWQNYETAKQSWEVNWDQMATATQLRDVALGRYKEGIGSILDVLNAQLQYSNALQSQLQTRFNLLTTRVDLVRAAGVLNLDNMVPLDAPASTGTNPMQQGIY
jgi:outer membrane protein